MSELLPGAAPAPARRRKADDLPRLRLRRPRRATLLRLGAAVASGVLAAVSRPPADIGFLALVALVPLFLAWRGRGARGGAGYAFVTGAVYYGITCSWIWYFGAVAIVPFVAVCAAYWAAAGAVLGWLRGRGVANPFLTAAVWVVADGVIARWPVGGFSWGELGYALHDVAPARALASFGGLALVTFVVVAANALVADLLAAAFGPAPLRSALFAYAGVGLVLLATIGATFGRTVPETTDFMRVALVQGNDRNRDLTDAEIDARYLPDSHFGLAAGIRDPVDLIVFPESSMDDHPADDPYLRERLAAIARAHAAWVLANATVDAPPDGTRAANLDVMFGPDGAVDGFYTKRHLVPFGEYVPLRNVLEGRVAALEAVPRDFVPGKSRGIFDVAGTPTGMLICFESAFGAEVRPLVRAGSQVLVVSTNNRSYRRSANSAQHLAIGQMRAAETGRPVVQAAISGISATIDADGVVHRQTALFERTVLEATVAAKTGETPYLRFGDWVTILAAAGAATAAAVAVIRRRRPASVDSDGSAVVRESLAGGGPDGSSAPAANAAGSEDEGVR